MARVITAPGIVRNVSKYLNSMRRVPFAIGKDDWTEVDSSTYTYEFVTAYVTTSSFDIGTFDNSVRSYAKGDISMEKKDGGGGMVFTTTKRPTGTVSGSIYIWDNNDNKVPVILEDTVVPIENGGTDATSVPGILSKLGLGSANDAQETLDFGDAVHEDVANNVTTTSEGYVLDARQGKVLKDSVDSISEQIANRSYIVSQWVTFSYFNANQLVGEYSAPTVPTGYAYRLMGVCNVFANNELGVKFNGAFLDAGGSKIRAEGSGFISSDSVSLLVMFQIYKT